MRTNTRRAASALLVAATFVASPLFAQGDDQKRQPPASRPAPPGRKPETPPPQRATPRPPAPAPPSAKAVPRPPAQPRPQPQRPPVRPEPRSYIYPYYPIWDFDFRYEFPYGAYPYWRYGYPYPPYLYPGLEAVPNCVAAEADAHGSVRIDIPQKDAEVYVDGFYVGVVEDFNGTRETLNLVPGPHRLELRAPGYETLTFDVNVEVGRTITYRTGMQPVR